MVLEWHQVNIGSFVFQQGETDSPCQMPQSKSNKIKSLSAAVLYVWWNGRYESI